MNVAHVAPSSTEAKVRREAPTPQGGRQSISWCPVPAGPLGAFPGNTGWKIDLVSMYESPCFPTSGLQCQACAQVLPPPGSLPLHSSPTHTLLSSFTCSSPWTPLCWAHALRPVHTPGCFLCGVVIMLLAAGGKGLSG